MAATFSVQGGTSITYVFTDKSQNVTNCSLYTPSDTTFDNAKAFAEALAGDLELASDAHLDGYTINRRYVAQGAAAAVAGGQVEQKLKIENLTAAGKSSIFSIPAPKVTMLLPNEREADVTNATIASILNLLTTGDGTTAPVDSNGSDLVSLIRTYIKHRASRIG